MHDVLPLDKIFAIETELNRADQVRRNVPMEVGMFRIKSANLTIMEAAQRPDPESLWMKLWYEGEVCCLFSDSNLGKSILAVQIAAEIAKYRRVLYFDFELSDKQFQLRYTDDESKRAFTFPDNLFRVEINPEAFTTENFEDALIVNIENAALQTEAKVLIIDNLTYLCNASEKGDAAGLLMMRLMKLKRKYGWSILILAHTPKRQLTSPITQNDLAGSKKLYNFFDSVFTIGKSAKDESLRYIKQLKVRFGGYTLDADNVMSCIIEKHDGFLQFVQQGFNTEREHLKEQSETDKAQLETSIRDLKGEGYSIRGIAQKLGCSQSKVQRVLSK